VPIEDTLGDAVEGGAGPRDGEQVASVVEGADDGVNELDGESGERHCQWGGGEEYWWTEWRVFIGKQWQGS